MHQLTKISTHAHGQTIEYKINHNELTTSKCGFRENEKGELTLKIAMLYNTPRLLFLVGSIR